MGLKKSNPAIYLNIVNGKLARRFKQPTNDTVERTTSENTVVYEEYFKSIDGHIVALDMKPPPQGRETWGDTLLVYIKSDNQIYCLQMPMNGRYAMNFLKTLPNVKLEKIVEITPSEKDLGDGKRDQTVFLRQDDQPVKRFYTKETTELPQPVKRKKGKKEIWEWDDVIAFLEETVYVPFKQSLKDKGAFAVPPTDHATVTGDTQPTGDDLPF